MQNQNPNETSTGLTQKILIPEVRYHPTIQTQTPEVRVRTTKTRTSCRPGGRCSAHTGNQGGDNTAQGDPVSDLKPGSDGAQKQKPSSQKPAKKSNKKLDHIGAADADLPQKPAQFSQNDHPRPEEIPLVLGVQVDSNVVEKVEVLTRGQRTNQHWFSWRKNRITASVAHRIAHCRFVNGKSRTPPTSYLAAITGEGPRFQTRAMSWGIEMEAEVVRRYQRLKSSALGRSILVQDCGLFIDVRHPWLAASPDGIVTDSETGERLLCLEVKCPYKHRQRRVEEACRDDPAFCLQIQEDKDGRESRGAPVYRLKTSHSYFTQIQCQLAATGLRHADLVVFTLKETAIVPVSFDPDLWEETVSKLEVFYRDAILPKLREKAGPRSVAAWKPEQ